MVNSIGAAGLNSPANQSNTLSNINNDGSFLVAGRGTVRGMYTGPGQLRGDLVNVTVSASTPGNRNAAIEINVRPLTGNKLGLLNTSQANLQQLQDRAAANINRENIGAYGKGTNALRGDAIRSGYYNSPAHRAWAEAAEARTGGRIPADWWMRNDPFGGTAGNGPNIVAEGQYPGTVSTIAMGHDTDWTLGRHFNAGPLKSLYGAQGKPADLGSYGLVPFHSVDRFGPSNYPVGHPDWEVNYR